MSIRPLHPSDRIWHADDGLRPCRLSGWLSGRASGFRRVASEWWRVRQSFQTQAPKGAGSPQLRRTGLLPVWLKPGSRRFR